MAMDLHLALRRDILFSVDSMFATRVVDHFPQRALTTAMLLLCLCPRPSTSFKLPLTTGGTPIPNPFETSVSATSTPESDITHTSANAGSHDVSFLKDNSKFASHSHTSESPVTTESLLESILSTTSASSKLGSDSLPALPASVFINESIADDGTVVPTEISPESSIPVLLSLLRTLSTPVPVSYTNEAADDAVASCSSRDSIWTNPCGLHVKRRSLSDIRDLSARLDGIQHYANDSVNTYILTQYIKDDYVRRILERTTVTIFPRIVNCSTYNDKLTAISKTLYTFVANINYVRSCGLTAIQEDTLSQRLAGLRTMVYQAICTTEIAAIQAGLHIAVPSSESVMSERVRGWANSGTAESVQLQAVYFIVKDLEKVTGMVKELFQ